MFKDKKILFLCKETYSYPLYFLAKKWSDTNEVAAYFFMAPECMYNKSLLNSSTYYMFKGLKNVKVFDVCKMADEFTKKRNAPVDKDYLLYLEDNFSHFRNLNQQLMSSQFTTKHYHFRNYYKNFTYEEMMNWLIANYRDAIKLIEDFLPDIIIDYDDAELPRMIINEISYKKNIPYITIDHPRFEFYKTYTFNLGLQTSKIFNQYYQKNLLLPKEELLTEYDYINNYRIKTNIMPKEYLNTITSQYKAPSILMSVKSLLGKVLYFWNQDVTSRNRKLKKSNPLIYPSSKEYLKYYFKVEKNRRKLFKRNSYFEDPVENEDYVYMPLHLIPESTTFVKAPFYVDELNIIEAVSKSLPINCKLYVKEHQAMLGERDLSFYKKVRELHNVRLVSVNYYQDPKPWIENSLGVVTITGTTAFEAALLSKPAFVFGTVLFDIIDGITKVNSFSELPILLSNLKLSENIHSCAAYIATVKQLGTNFKFKYLMSEGENILLHNKEVTEQFNVELLKLEAFYFNAYDRYYGVDSNEKAS